MKRFGKIGIGVVLSVFFNSCGNDDTQAEVASFLIVGVIEEQNIVSSFDSNTGEVLELGEIGGYYDVTFVTPYVYTVATSIERTDIRNFEDQAVVPVYGLNFFQNKIEGFGDRIVYISNTLNEMNSYQFMNTYDLALNLLDSVVLRIDPAGFPMIAVDIKTAKDFVFVSSASFGNQTFEVDVYSLAAGQILFTFSFDQVVNELVHYEDKLYGFADSEFYVMDYLAGEVEKSPLDSRASIERSTSVTFTGDQTFLYLSATDQPAPVPFLLEVYDLRSQSVTKTLSDFSINVSHPLIYSQSTGEVISGGDFSELKIFDLKEDRFEEVETSYDWTNHLFPL